MQAFSMASGVFCTPCWSHRCSSVAHTFTVLCRGVEIQYQQACVSCVRACLCLCLCLCENGSMKRGIVFVCEHMTVVELCLHRFIVCRAVRCTWLIVTCVTLMSHSIPIHSTSKAGSSLLQIQIADRTFTFVHDMTGTIDACVADCCIAICFCALSTDSGQLRACGAAYIGCTCPRHDGIHTRMCHMSACTMQVRTARSVPPRFPPVPHIPCCVSWCRCIPNRKHESIRRCVLDSRTTADDSHFNPATTPRQHRRARGHGPDVQPSAPCERPRGVRGSYIATPCADCNRRRRRKRCPSFRAPRVHRLPLAGGCRGDAHCECASIFGARDHARCGRNISGYGVDVYDRRNPCVCATSGG
eukprot:m.803630 g.803630  ORF g.803630 m.803630 type:complete len:358 (-) comp23367_c0_seq5:53-1126(-)